MPSRRYTPLAMDFRLWTPLFSAVLAGAIAVKVALRERKRRMHWLFVGFAANVAVWYLTTFLDYRAGPGATGMSRVAALTAVLLPQTAVRFLRTFRLDAPDTPGALERWSTRLGVVMLGAVLSPWFTQRIPGVVIRVCIAAYVVGLLIAAVSALYTRGRAAPSAQERRRALYLVGVSVLATLVTTADLVPFTINRLVHVELPPIGSILVLAVLYMFSEVIERRRLIDLYELAGRFVVLTALALVLAGIYYRLVDWQVLARNARRDEGPYFLNAIVASLVILILFDPLREKVEERIGRFFFGERYDFERSLLELRGRIAHTLELDSLGRELMEGLAASRRVTTASLYLVDADRKAVDLYAHLGAEPERHLELASLRALLDHLQSQGAAAQGLLQRELEDRQELRETREAEGLTAVLLSLDQLDASVVVPLSGEGGELLGLLGVHDDRVRDAFLGDEVQLLRGLAGQCAVVVENSVAHTRIRERDRLAALGEMAAGLAHEIRNPLGGIKGAAQFLEGGIGGDATQREFLGIIIEEVGRLDRVVSSFLEYARPYRGNPGPLDVNHALERTAQLLRGDLPSGVELKMDLGPNLVPVRIDAEHLRQAVLNLVRNSVEAMQGSGVVTVRTVPRRGTEGVEIHVRDTGPGIDPEVRKNLFIPFFTTKTQGTGLGLAISQRVIEASGGRIVVRASDATGSTFVITLPAAPATPSLPPVASAPAPEAAAQG